MTTLQGFIVGFLFGVIVGALIERRVRRNLARVKKVELSEAIERLEERMYSVRPGEVTIVEWQKKRDP